MTLSLFRLSSFSLSISVLGGGVNQLYFWTNLFCRWNPWKWFSSAGYNVYHDSFLPSADRTDWDASYSLHTTFRGFVHFGFWIELRPRTLRSDLPANTTHISHEDYVCKAFVICFPTPPFITPRDENVKQMTSLLHIDFFSSQPGPLI